MSFQFRFHQEEDVQKLLRPAMVRSKRVTFEASVGYGKTKVIFFLSMSYSRAGKRVWVLSNRSAVVDQLADATAGLSNVLVTTVQAADHHRSAMALEPADLILIDEAHMGGAATQYGRVMDCAPNARVVAFTGTPTPELFDVFPEHVKGHGARWLTDNGWLAPLRYHTPQKLDTSRVPLRDGEYDPRALVELLEQSKIYGDAIESYRAFGLGVPTLGFCVNVNHARATAERFRKAGHECMSLIGSDSPKAVKRKIDFLKDGGFVIAVDKVSAGFDLPDLRCLIPMRPSKSEQLWVQQLGRGARAAEGKEFCWVADHADNARKLGSLTEERDWRNLEATRAQRLTADGENLAMRTCDSCLASFDAGPVCCPYCGEKLAKETRLPKAETARLAEITAAELDAQRQADKALLERCGLSIKSRTSMLLAKRVPFVQARRKAIEGVQGRLSDARRYGDAEVAAWAEQELRSVGAL